MNQPHHGLVFDRKNTVKALLALVVVPLMGELGLRAVGPRLDPPLDFYSPIAQRCATQLRGMEDTGEEPDVVFLGSSMTGFDIDVAVFESITGLSAWNGGIPAAQVTVLERWGLEEVVPIANPDLVVVGLSSLEFNGNRLDPTIERYNEQRHSKVGVLAEVDRWASARSHWIARRPQLRRPGTFLLDLVGDAVEAGEPPRLKDRALAAEATRIRDEVLVDFEVSKAEHDALERLIAALRDHGHRVAIVWMPVPTTYPPLHPGGPDDFEVARRRVEATASSFGVSFVDLANSRPDTSFVDLTHLDAKGAEAFTADLVEALRQQGDIGA